VEKLKVSRLNWEKVCSALEAEYSAARTQAQAASGNTAVFWTRVGIILHIILRVLKAGL
jgi:hypothetical protein